MGPRDGDPLGHAYERVGRPLAIIIQPEVYEERKRRVQPRYQRQISKERARQTFREMVWRVDQVERLLPVQTPERAQHHVVETENERRQKAIVVERPGHFQLVHRNAVIVECVSAAEALTQHGYTMAARLEHERRIDGKRADAAKRGVGRELAADDADVQLSFHALASDF